MTLQSEPSVIIGGITAFVTAAIGLLVAFGLDIDQQQQTAILGMTAVLAPVLASVAIRFRVFSPATTERLTDEAYAAGVPPVEPKPPLPEPPADN
jgi:hypothetical protein